MFSTSDLTTAIIDFPIALLKISPIPIGRSPGFLFKGIPLFAKRVEILSGSINIVAILLAAAAKELHKSTEESLNEQTICATHVHQLETPAAPSVRKILFLISCPSSGKNGGQVNGRNVSSAQRISGWSF